MNSELALSPLGERVARRRRFLQPVGRRGRVRGSVARARGSGSHISRANKRRASLCASRPHLIRRPENSFQSVGCYIGGPWAFRRCAKNHLDTGFPVAGAPMAMSNGQDLDSGGQLTVNHRKRKSMQQEFAGTMRTGGPALRRFSNHANGLRKLAGKLRGARLTACKVPIKSLFVFRTCFLEKFDGLSGHE